MDTGGGTWVMPQSIEIWTQAEDTWVDTGGGMGHACPQSIEIMDTGGGTWVMPQSIEIWTQAEAHGSCLRVLRYGHRRRHMGHASE